MLHPLTATRLATVAASGFRDVYELADAVLAQVSQVCKHLLDSGSLNETQTRRVRATLRDTPIAFAALTGFPLPDEESKANLVFVAAMLIDDVGGLSALATTVGYESVVSRVMEGATAGGLKSAKTRQERQKAWRGLVLALAGEILAKNLRLTQDDLVAKLRERWKPEWPRLPVHWRVVAFLSQAERDGLLPKRTT
jgi:hypothetical protein